MAWQAFVGPGISLVGGLLGSRSRKRQLRRMKQEAMRRRSILLKGQEEGAKAGLASLDAARAGIVGAGSDASGIANLAGVGGDALAQAMRRGGASAASGLDRARAGFETQSILDAIELETHDFMGDLMNQQAPGATDHLLGALGSVDWTDVFKD